MRVVVTGGCSPRYLRVPDKYVGDRAFEKAWKLTMAYIRLRAVSNMHTYINGMCIMCEKEEP